MCIRDSLGTAEHPAVVQKGSAPDPLRVQIAAAGDPGIGLLVDQNAVAVSYTHLQRVLVVQVVCSSAIEG